MRLEVQIEEGETYLLIKAVGPYSLADLHVLFDQVKKGVRVVPTREYSLMSPGLQGPFPSWT